MGNPIEHWIFSDFVSSFYTFPLQLNDTQAKLVIYTLPYHDEKA